MTRYHLTNDNGDIEVSSVDYEQAKDVARLCDQQLIIFRADVDEFRLPGGRTRKNSIKE